MDDFEQGLLDLVSNAQMDDTVRDRAATALKQWRDGIMPSGKTLAFFAEARKGLEPCSRAGNDGSCGWLRKRGAGYGLPVPPKGQRAMCVFPTAFNKCPGYKKERV